jgi:hypothetical protein
MNTSFSRKVCFISQYGDSYLEGILWPDIFAIERSNGKILSIDDVLYYNSGHTVPREMVGGHTSVPSSKDGCIEGPMDGYDDGEITGRMLKASKFSNFDFFEIDLDGINPQMDEIEFFLYFHDYKKKEQPETLSLENLKVYIAPIPNEQDVENFDFWEMIDYGKKIILSNTEVVIDIPVTICKGSALLLGSFRRNESNGWRYEYNGEFIFNIEEYINKFLTNY